MKRIQKELRTTAELRNVSAKWAWVESVIARGGPEVGMAAYQIYRNESIGAWKKVLEEVGWSDEFEANTPASACRPASTRAGTSAPTPRASPSDPTLTRSPSDSSGGACSTLRG